jgi:hypothetical protein
MDSPILSGNDGKGLFKSLKSIPTEHAVQFGHIW